MMKFTVLTAATLLSAPAFAGGLGDVAPEPQVAAYDAPVQANTGGDWSGAYVGAQVGYGDLKSNGAGLDGDGAIGGVHAGYRYDFGQFVAGAELDYDTANVDLGAGVGELDNVARLKLKGGYDLGRTLVYGTIGAAYAEASVGGTTLKDNGYFGGIGVDYAISDQFSVGGEYLAHKFNDFDGSGADLDVNTLTARVSFKF
jgi:outer membrane immunogenic protein